MSKFRCIICNEAIELNQSRGFKMSEHKCRCGGTLQAMFHCEVFGEFPERIEANFKNTYMDPISRRQYFNAWRNSRRYVFIIDKSHKFVELTFDEHNMFDFKS